MKKRSKALKKVALALAGLSAVAASGGAMAAMQISTNGGLSVYDPTNSCYFFCLNGRVELDEVYYSGNWRDRQANFASSANIRRAVLALSGGIGDCLSYNVSLDFGRSAADWSDVASPSTFTRVRHGQTLIQEAWLAYTGLWDCTRVRIGQFTPIATIDFYANDGTGNGQMFLESALETLAFNIPSYTDTDSRMLKGLGVILETHFCDMFTLAGTLYQPADGSGNNYGVRGASDRLGGALRATFSPVHDCDQVIHIGGMARYQTLNHTQANAPVFNTLFFTPPEVISRNYVGNPRIFSASTVGDPNLLDVGGLRTKDYQHYAAEVLGICGPITLAGEYHHANVRRQITNTATENKHLRFNGWHVQAGYVLTGESRCYDFATGTLGGIKPCSPYGAWEIVARYSFVTLNNKDVFGGKGHNATAGVNWFVNENVRLAFNYIRSNLSPTGTTAGLSANAGPKRHLDIFAGRVQFIF